MIEQLVVTDSVIIDKLACLGATPNTVAYSLTTLGIKGIPRISTCCPIANYLRRVCNTDNVVVNRWIYVDKHTIDIDDYTALEGVRDFINLFDKCRYPQLME